MPSRWGSLTSSWLVTLSIALGIAVGLAGSSAAAAVGPVAQDHEPDCVRYNGGAVWTSPEACWRGDVSGGEECEGDGLAVDAHASVDVGSVVIEASDSASACQQDAGDACLVGHAYDVEAGPTSSHGYCVRDVDDWEGCGLGVVGAGYVVADGEQYALGACPDPWLPDVFALLETVGQLVEDLGQLAENLADCITSPRGGCQFQEIRDE